MCWWAVCNAAKHKTTCSRSSCHFELLMSLSIQVTYFHTELNYVQMFIRIFSIYYEGQYYYLRHFGSSSILALLSVI